MKNVISIVHVPEEYACRLHPHDDTAMISITEPGHIAPLKEGWKNICRLQFHDVDRFIEGYTRFGIEDAKVIDQFLKALPDDVEELIIHCHAGVSRSAAVSYYLHQHLGLEIKNEGKFLLRNKHIVSVMRSYFESEKNYNEIFGGEK